MGFLSLSCHICVHATSVKLLGHVTETSLAPSPSHTLSLSLFHPPMALHRILLPWVHACQLPNCDPSQVFSEGVSGLGCILSHELSKLPHLGQAEGLQETHRLPVGHSCHWDEVPEQSLETLAEPGGSRYFGQHLLPSCPCGCVVKLSATDHESAKPISRPAPRPDHCMTQQISLCLIRARGQGIVGPQHR